MTFTTAKTKKALNINELKELLALMEIQETTDREVNKSLIIHGNYARIEVKIDRNGNVTVL